MKNAIIIICSDHGDAFNEHGTFSHPRQLYEELIKVPLVIKLPDKHNKIVIHRPVGLMNVAPTVLDYLGFNLKEFSFAGESLLPLLDNESKEDFPQYIISNATPDRDSSHMCIRTKEWKFIRNESTDRKELYNLVNDPKEQQNLKNSELEIARKLEKTLVSVKLNMDAKASHKEDEEVLMDDEMKKRLKSLGYL